MIDHVTFQMTHKELHDPEMRDFFALLGMYELNNPEQRDTAEQGWDVRWFADHIGDLDGHCVVHLVGADSPVALGLGHICVRVGEPAYRRARRSKWLERASGSGRLWLKGPGWLRVEVRP